MLLRCANGFGAVALSALFAEDGRAASAPDPALNGGLHHRATAHNVIFLYMDGGPSQVDTFDPKPLLTKYDGKDPHSVFTVEPTQFNNVGKVMGSPWKFKQYGQSGLWVSDLFPHVAECVDDIAIMRSMTSMFPEHTSANYFLHTGSGFQGRPSMGAWVSYGLGSMNKNLPGFIVLNGGLIPPGGLDNFNSGFLPAAYQGSIFRAGDPPVANIERIEKNDGLQRNKLDLMKRLDEAAEVRYGKTDEIESAVANYETAYRMQTAVPELMDVKGESAATRRTLRLECEVSADANLRPPVSDRPAAGGARRPLHRIDLPVHRRPRPLGPARRPAQRPRGQRAGGRSAHRGAIKRLKRSRFAEKYAGDLGRRVRPDAVRTGADGRDHNPFGFTVWMAGGGAKGGFAYGETDEFGYKVVDKKMEMYDFHATMLHLLGVDHKRLTFRFGGRDMRLPMCMARSLRMCWRKLARTQARD